MKRHIKYDEQKLTEVILYVADKCAWDEHYGVLKLNKILFYSDFRAFQARGKPITGAEYRKYTHGPAPSVMKSLKAKLEEEGAVLEWEHFLLAANADGEQLAEKRLLARRAPAIDGLLEAEEVAIIDAIIEWLRPMTGKQVSRLSHRHPGWRLARMEEQIPYFAALLPTDDDDLVPLTAGDMKRAEEVAARFAAGAPSR